MVDALRAAHRRIREAGLLVDARPDARYRARILARGRVRTHLEQNAEVEGDDAAADAAMARVIAEGLFRPVRSGRLWYRSNFANLRELDTYVRTSARYGAYAPSSRAPLMPFRDGPLVMRRVMKFAVLARV